MRKLTIIATILIVSIATAFFIACKGKKTEKETTNTEDSVKKVLARGDYLVNHVTPCLDCHSNRDFTKNGGPVTPGTEGMGGFVFDQKLGGVPGVVYSRNITPDAETGIGTWTDDDILKAMTQGINKKGDTLFPIMPYANFSHMSKGDLMAIIAYIKTLKPIKNKVPDRKLMIPISMAYPGPAIAKSVDGNMAPPESDQVSYGGYLVNAAACGECHTPMTPKGPDMSKMFAGGFHFDVGTFVVNTANITPDSATGIGTWTEDRFLTKFQQYRNPDFINANPGKQNTIMPVVMYSGMTDADLKAIFAYLKTLKPVSNKIEKWPTK
jgi:cytochrome c553